MVPPPIDPGVIVTSVAPIIEEVVDPYPEVTAAVAYEERLSPANVTTITEEVVAEPVPEPSPAIDLELEEIEELTRNL